MDKKAKILITGGGGMVGKSLISILQNEGYTNLLSPSSEILDLKIQADVYKYFKENKPEYVIFLAAKVGGINANIEFPGTFIAENLLMQTNTIEAARLYEIKKFVFLGSSCIYPKECPQPMKEEYLLTGKLEPTNEGYAIAKIAGIKMLQAYKKQFDLSSINIMPCNLYGPNDSFDLRHSHVLSALVKRFVDAKKLNQDSITLWGSGVARREFMHVDDCANGILFMLKNYNSTDIINLGTGKDISIKELAESIAEKVGYKGKIKWDTSKPDGMLKKCMNVEKMKEFGFTPKISLSAGIDQMITIYKNTL